MTKNSGVKPNLIDEIAGGYRAAQILFAANRLGIFRVLANERLTYPEIARKLNSDPRGMRIVCDALVGMSLLEREGERYRNGEAALEHLVADAPDSRIAQLEHAAVLYDRWGGLTETVRTGRPSSPEIQDGPGDESRRAFARAMADSARKSAAATAEMLDLSKVRHLLDVGGGPGSFAVEFARRNPELTVTILDDAQTLEVARASIEEAGFSDRIRTLAGSVFESDLGKGYDFIFVSNVVHIYSEPENELLVRRCAKALAPGGTLSLKDFFLEEDRSGSLFALLFAVNMLVNTAGGDCYTFGQADRWFQQAGLIPTGRLALTPHSFLLTAKAP